MSFIYRFALICVALYCAILAAIYLYQDRLIFHPQKLEKDYKFEFSQPFLEINVAVGNDNINGLCFTAKEPKGAVLFLHGNAGNIAGWGANNSLFTQAGYDFYVFDYRGYGKSSGEISSQNALYADTDAMMQEVLRKFSPNEVTIVGYSLGSGLAARLAQKYGAKRLILLAPYYKFSELAASIAPFVPQLAVKYKIPTANFLQDLNKTQISIFHGSQDTLIPLEHSKRLAKFLKNGDSFFELNSSHNDIFLNEVFRQNLREILSKPPKISP